MKATGSRKKGLRDNRPMHIISYRLYSDGIEVIGWCSYRKRIKDTDSLREALMTELDFEGKKPDNVIVTGIHRVK